ncbi:11461_t:CDS:2, partial [Racocetra fulgida]
MAEETENHVVDMNDETGANKPVNPWKLIRSLERKYPLMADIILYSVVELVSGFAPNFQVFVALRAIFGIAMGGEWGLGAALAMEVLPPEARYPTGYLLAAIFYYAVIKTLGWRAMFWIGSFPALVVVFMRFFVPESKAWEKQHEARKLTNHNTFNEMKTDVTVTTVIANIGAIMGGTLCGYLSQYFGRKKTVVIAMILAGAFLPIIAIPVNKQLVTFGAFIVYFFVQLSPPAFRGTFPGLTYQLGNLIAASAAQIEAVLGEAFPKNGVANYGLTIAVFSACAMFGVIVFISTGSENRNVDFMKQAETGSEENEEAVIETKNA